MSSGLGQPLRSVKARRGGGPRLYLLGLGMVLALIAAGCARGAYPLDFFYEMHYQQSYRSHEPPRLSPPEGAVPWFPPPRSPAFADGRHLFEVNCAICHGPGAKGDGPVLNKMKAAYGYQEKAPTNLTVFPVTFIEEVVSFTSQPGRSRFFGEESIMPPFGKLLSLEERRLIAEYITTLPK